MLLAFVTHDRLFDRTLLAGGPLAWAGSVSNLVRWSALLLSLLAAVPMAREQARGSLRDEAKLQRYGTWFMTFLGTNSAISLVKELTFYAGQYDEGIDGVSVSLNAFLVVLAILAICWPTPMWKRPNRA